MVGIFHSGIGTLSFLLQLPCAWNFCHRKPLFPQLMCSEQRVRSLPHFQAPSSLHWCDMQVYHCPPQTLLKLASTKALGISASSLCKNWVYLARYSLLRVHPSIKTAPNWLVRSSVQHREPSLAFCDDMEGWDGGREGTDV